LEKGLEGVGQAIIDYLFILSQTLDYQG